MTTIVEVNVTTRRLDNTDLDNLEDAAHGRTGVGVLAHPVDVLRLVAEVRWYKAWMDDMAKATGYDPRSDTAQTPPPQPLPIKNLRTATIGGRECVVGDVYLPFADEPVVVNDTPPTAEIRKVTDVPEVVVTGGSGPDYVTQSPPETVPNLPTDGESK